MLCLRSHKPLILQCIANFYKILPEKLLSRRNFTNLYLCFLPNTRHLENISQLLTVKWHLIGVLFFNSLITREMNSCFCLLTISVSPSVAGRFLAIVVVALVLIRVLFFIFLICR